MRCTAGGLNGQRLIHQKKKHRLGRRNEEANGPWISMHHALEHTNPRNRSWALAGARGGGGLLLFTMHFTAFYMYICCSYGVSMRGMRGHGIR